MATGYRAANCAECQEGISTERPGCTALDKTFHLDCFRCIGCRQKLAGGSFYAVDGKPYCEQDYIETLDKCANCHRPIMDKILRANQRAYHPECFRCIHCGKGLDGVPFTVDSSNQVHCVECFHERYAPRCAQCHRPIVPEDGKDESYRVVAMDKSFHIDCYKCEDCGKKLSSRVEGHGCYPMDDHLLCKQCHLNRLQRK